MVIDKFEGEYAFLSNFHPSRPIRDEYGITYPSVEHYFQAMKTLDRMLRIDIAIQPTPGKAKYLGRRINLREDWEQIKEQVMYDALIQKFSDPIMKKKLLATGDVTLIEGTTWHDNYWGVCSCEKCNGCGKNRLGELLMKLREELKESELSF